LRRVGVGAVEDDRLLRERRQCRRAAGRVPVDGQPVGPQSIDDDEDDGAGRPSASPGKCPESKGRQHERDGKAEQADDARPGGWGSAERSVGGHAGQSFGRRNAGPNLSIIGRMTRLFAAIRYTALILSCALFAASASAQSKGNARINGKILDDQGKPAAGVLIRAIKAGESAPVEIRTNDKGEWKLENLAAGSWNFEFLKDGFAPERMTVELTNRNPPIDTKLTKAIDPNVELQAGMTKALELQKSGKGEEARKVILDLAAKYPEAYRLNAFVAQTYAEEKNWDKAIEHLTIVVDKEPADVDMKTFLAELYTMKGDKAGAKKVLDAVDITQVKDATIFINAAITSINAGQTDEAIATLDKLAKQFPTQANILYYRGRANIAAKKYAEAKVDLEKFVSMAPPDARELPDAKKLLEQLKDVK
jgi:tetratricopeptide (TPR) repeat protein